MERHDRWNGLLEQVAGVQEGAVAPQADDEVDLIREIVLAVSERHQLVLDRQERGAFLQESFFHDGGFHEDHHAFFLRNVNVG